MKMLCSLLLALATTVPVLGQGKVRFVNDSLHLVYWDPMQFPTLGGHAYQAGDLGVTFAIELWAGTASSSLSLVATTDFAGQAGAVGTWAAMNLTLPTGFPSGA